MEQPKWTVLIADFDYADNRIEEESLEPWGARVISAQCRTDCDVVEAGRDADAIICQYAPISADVIGSLPRCRVLARFGIGVDVIDVAAATDRGIPVINVPSYCEDEVSDHALAMLLAWARRICRYAADAKRGTWDWKTGRPIRRLRGQTLGLLGFGKIARVLAHKAQGLGLTVIAHDPFIPPDVFRAEDVAAVTIEELFRRSDFLSIHVPLTGETRHMVGAEHLRLMKDSACLINTSRGAVIDEGSLIAALGEGRISGACLDVVEDERPREDNPLLTFSQVLLSPHVAWYSEESQIDLRRKVATDVGRALNGIRPDGLVNRELESRFTEPPRGG